MACLNGIRGLLMTSETTFRFGKRYESKDEYFADIERISNKLKDLHNCAILGFEPNFTIVNLATNETQNIPHWLLMKMIGEYVEPAPVPKQKYYKNFGGRLIEDTDFDEYNFYMDAERNLKELEDEESN